MICSSLCRVPFMVVLLSWFGRTHILGGPVFGGYVRWTNISLHHSTSPLQSATRATDSSESKESAILIAQRMTDRIGTASKERGSFYHLPCVKVIIPCRYSPLEGTLATWFALEHELALHNG